jgi:hypothetical protein
METPQDNYFHTRNVSGAIPQPSQDLNALIGKPKSSYLDIPLVIFGAGVISLPSSSRAFEILNVASIVAIAIQTLSVARY